MEIEVPKETETVYPIAEVSLWKGEHNRNQFVIVTCPYCEQSHWHGACEGHRLPHCMPYNVKPEFKEGYSCTGYILKWNGQVLPKNWKPKRPRLMDPSLMGN